MQRGDHTVPPPRAHTPPPPEKRWFPWLIPTFFVANVVLFVVTMHENNCPKLSVPPASCIASFLGRFSFQPLKQNPLFGSSALTLIKMGGLYLEKADRIHQAWRLFSCMWLHAGVIHLLLNMFDLLYFGILLEKKFGFVRIGLLYVMSGLGSSLLSALFMQSGVTIGASGAIMGLVGGLLSELTIHPNKSAEMWILIAAIIIGLALGLIIPNVNNVGHIGGLISGFLLGFVLLIRPHYKRFSQTNSHSAPPVHPKHKPYQYALWIISFVLLSVGFIGGLVLFLKGVDMNDHCPWCRYLSCVPTSKQSCNNELPKVAKKLVTVWETGDPKSETN